MNQIFIRMYKYKNKFSMLVFKCPIVLGLTYKQKEDACISENKHPKYTEDLV